MRNYSLIHLKMAGMVPKCKVHMVSSFNSLASANIRFNELLDVIIRFYSIPYVHARRTTIGLHLIRKGTNCRHSRGDRKRSFSLLRRRLLGSVVAILWLQLPHVLIRVPHVIVARLLQDLFEVHNWLFCEIQQFFYAVVLMFLEGCKEYVH